MITTDRWVMYLVMLSTRQNLDSLEGFNPQSPVKAETGNGITNISLPSFHFPQISNRTNTHKEIYIEEDRSLNIDVYRQPTHRSILAVRLSPPTGAQAGGHSLCRRNI